MNASNHTCCGTDNTLFIQVPHSRTLCPLFLEFRLLPFISAVPYTATHPTMRNAHYGLLVAINHVLCRRGTIRTSCLYHFTSTLYYSLNRTLMPFDAFLTSTPWLITQSACELALLSLLYIHLYLYHHHYAGLPLLSVLHSIFIVFDTLHTYSIPVSIPTSHLVYRFATGYQTFVNFSP